MNADSESVNQLTEQIIGCAFQVSNELGSGFLEKVYENALVIELRRSGFLIRQQHAITIRYKDAVVGEYVADILVENSVLLEIKAVRKLDDVHMAQCMNYLRATGLKVCLLLNFGTQRTEVKRIVNNL